MCSVKKAAKYWRQNQLILGTRIKQGYIRNKGFDDISVRVRDLMMSKELFAEKPNPPMPLKAYYEIIREKSYKD